MYLFHKLPTFPGCQLLPLPKYFCAPNESKNALKPLFWFNSFFNSLRKTTRESLEKSTFLENLL